MHLRRNETGFKAKKGFKRVTNGIEYLSSDGGIVVSIAAFQAVDPGSIPGHRKFYFRKYLQHCVFLFICV